MFQRLWNRFKSVKSYLRYPFIAAFIIVLLYNYILISIPSFIPYAYETGKLVNALSMSFIAAFIFAFINVHVGNYENKVKGSRYLNNKLSKIIRLNTALNNAIKIQNNVDTKEKVTKESLEIWCSNINPHNNVTINFRTSQTFDNWFILFNYIHSEIRDIIQFLSIQPLYSDSEISEILLNLEDLIDSHLNSFKGTAVNVMNGNLDYFTHSILDFNLYTDQIREYLKKLQEFSKESNEKLRKKEEKN